MAFNIVKEPCSIEGVFMFTPSSFTEKRGSIWTSYDSSYDFGVEFKHDKFSISNHNVLRGIHGDSKTTKLVSCVAGSILQVVVDMRESSSTYLQWESFKLGEGNISSILVPPGVGNAFYVVSEQATYHYKLAYEGEYADANEQFTVMWNDPRLNICWPTTNPILSERDYGKDNT